MLNMNPMQSFHTQVLHTHIFNLIQPTGPITLKGISDKTRENVIIITVIIVYKLYTCRLEGVHLTFPIS